MKSTLSYVVSSRAERAKSWVEDLRGSQLQSSYVIYELAHTHTHTHTHTRLYLLYKKQVTVSTSCGAINLQTIEPVPTSKKNESLHKYQRDKQLLIRHKKLSHHMPAAIKDVAKSKVRGRWTFIHLASKNNYRLH